MITSTKNKKEEKIITNLKKRIEDLRQKLEGKISAFSGNSGVRKIYNNKCTI